MQSTARGALDEVLEQAVADDRIPGVVAGVTTPLADSYIGAAGCSHAVQGTAMSADALFRIASMTKVVTSVAAMMLYEEGRFQLDDAVTGHLPDFEVAGVLIPGEDERLAPVGTAVTLRHLFTHTSGLCYPWLDPQMQALQRQGRIDVARVLAHQPGEKFTYGTSTDVLGRVVERLSGQPLDEFFRERIFQPLRMVDTDFGLTPDQSARLVAVHARGRQGLYERRQRLVDSTPHGGAGLHTTVCDYLRFLCALLQVEDHGVHQLLRPETLLLMGRNHIGDLAAGLQRTVDPETANDFVFMDGSQKFGLGSLVETRDRETGRSRGSYSWGGIFNTFFWVDPVREIAGVIMMQLLPFADVAAVDTHRRFETAVYGALC